MAAIYMVRMKFKVPLSWRNCKDS